MTTPVKIQKQVDRWVCATCKREHEYESNATGCCVCEKCEKRTATKKEQPYYSRPSLCTSCHRAKVRQGLRYEVDAAELEIARAQERIDAATARKRDAVAKLDAMRVRKETTEESA